MRTLVPSLGPHLRQTHDWTAHDYRTAFGLNVQCALEAPGTAERRSNALKRRIKTDSRLRETLRLGLALARTGALNELGRPADAERGRALERRRRTQEQGRRVATARAARFREQRQRRARELGFADLEALVSHRYLAEGASVAEIADTLGCAQIKLIAEMDRLGIPRRPQDQRLPLGRAVLAAQRANKARAHEARVRELGFDGLAAYFRARHHDQGWPYPLIAQELGLTVAVVRRLMQQADVPGFRGVRLAKARR